jgi:hypothetical protein
VIGNLVNGPFAIGQQSEGSNARADGANLGSRGNCTTAPLVTLT